MTNLKLIAGGVALLAAFGAGWTGRGWLADKETADAVADAAVQAAKAWAKEVEDGRKAVDEKEGRLKEFEEANKNLSMKLREAYAANPETAALAAMCLPDDIIRLLR